MSETMNRVLVAAGLILGLLGAIWLQNHGFPTAIYWIGLLVCAGMIFEFLYRLWYAPRDVMFNQKNLLLFLGFLGLLILDFMSIMTVGRRPMVMLMILVKSVMLKFPESAVLYYYNSKIEKFKEENVF